MKPLEAGFDGVEGICMGVSYIKDGGIYLLKRGKKNPSDFPNINFKNQICWYYPDGQDPKLLFCNSDGHWFNLSFESIDLQGL